LRLNTSGYGGRRLKKTAEIYSDDKKLPVARVQISGIVEKFLTIIPRAISLRGFVGDDIKRSVTIIPEKKYDFKITKVRARNGKHIHFELKEIEGTGRKEYSLTVENLLAKEGRYSDLIILETDSKIRPRVNVKVYGNLRQRPAKKE
jgi:hypothetical protein